MDKGLTRRAREGIASLKEGRGKIFVYMQSEGKQVLEISRFHVVDATTEGFLSGQLDEPVSQKVRQSLRRVLRTRSRATGCAGIFYQEGARSFFRISARQRMLARELTVALQQHAAALGLTEIVVQKTRARRQ